MLDAGDGAFVVQELHEFEALHFDHVAFGSRGFESTKQHLTAKGIPHRVNQVPNSTRWQIFLRDPNNVEIELNFETKNEQAG